MKSFGKKIILCTLCLATLLSTAGCGQKQQTDAMAAELQLNDYRGGIIRTAVVKDGIISLMDDMKQNNTAIRKDSPYSFWSTDGYQDFVTNFLNDKIIDDTQYFNEEKWDWATTLSTIAGSDCTFTTGTNGNYKLKPNVTITRNEKDDYSVTGLKDVELYSGAISYRILYDCDKDWCKAYREVQLSGDDMPAVTEELFEYARLDQDTFVVQTSKERLMVVYDSVEQDTDLRKRTIKEFYYSKLVGEGARTTFKPFETISEFSETTGEHIQAKTKYNESMLALKDVNAEGGLADRYGNAESIFKLDLSEIKPEWVFEDKSLQQAIIFKEGNLVVTTFNKLSEKYERFIYQLADANDSAVASIESMVEIKNLVGIISVPAAIVNDDRAGDEKKDDSSSQNDDNDESLTEEEKEWKETHSENTNPPLSERTDSKSDSSSDSSETDSSTAEE